MKIVFFAGKTRPVTWNMAAFMEMAQTSGTSMETYTDDGVDTMVLMRMLHLGLKYGAEQARQKFDMSFGDFCDHAYMNEEEVKALSEALSHDFMLVTKRLVENAKKKGLPAEMLTGLEKSMTMLSEAQNQPTENSNFGTSTPPAS
jgi:hypothetical protein